jgi:hypothetical protein
MAVIAAPAKLLEDRRAIAVRCHNERIAQHPDAGSIPARHQPVPIMI